LNKINNQSIISPEPCIAFRVDLPNGDYSLVPEAEEGEAEVALQYVEVLEGLNQSIVDLSPLPETTYSTSHEIPNNEN
jgi:hypothetical protein